MAPLLLLQGVTAVSSGGGPTALSDGSGTELVTFIVITCSCNAHADRMCLPLLYVTQRLPLTVPGGSSEYSAHPCDINKKCLESPFYLFSGRPVARSLEENWIEYVIHQGLFLVHS